MKTKRNSTGFGIVELLLSLIVLALIGAIGWVVYRNVTMYPVSGVTTMQAVRQMPAAVDPYAGWKTYVLPEDNTVSFRYPSDWIIVGDFKDTSSVLYNQFFKIMAPVKYNNDGVVFIFRYSPGKYNRFTQRCMQDGGYTDPVNSENITANGESLRILTNAFSIDSVKTIAMALVDSSNCYVVVPSGTIEATENLGSQSAPNYSIDLARWKSLAVSKTIDLIMKSVKF